MGSEGGGVSLALLHRARAALEQGHLELVVELLARSVQREGASAGGALLGIAYSGLEQHASALRLLEAAVEREPSSAPLRFNLGLALERAGQREPAARAYREALRLSPLHASAWSRLEPGRVAGPVWFDLSFVPIAEGEGSAERPALTGLESCRHCGRWSRELEPCSYCGRSQQEEHWREKVDSRMSHPEAFLRRWAACLIDHALLMVVWLPLAVAISRLSPVGLISAMALLPPTSPPVEAGALFYASVAVLYDWIAHGLYGQTVGKRLLGLRVVAEKGRPLTSREALLRATVGRLVASLPIYAFIFPMLLVVLIPGLRKDPTWVAVFAQGWMYSQLGYLWMLGHEDQQGWHDRLCGTYVIRR